MDKIKQFLFHNTSTKQTVVKNTFWLFTSEAIGRLLKIFLVIYAVRILGANGWGIFAYAMSLGSIMMIFSDIGIGNLITRELSRKNENYKLFVSNSSLIKILFSSISALLVIFFCPFISNIPEARGIFSIIALILFFDALRDLGISINRASEKMEKEMTVKFLMNITVIIIGIILLQINPKPESIAISYAIGSILGSFIILLIIKDNLKEIISKIDKNIIKEILKITLPFAVIGLIANIIANTDIFMLGIWKDSTEIGLYSSVQRIQQFTILIPTMIATAVLPIMSKYANKDNIKFKEITEKAILTIMLVGIPIAIGGFLLADQIVPLLFGLEYLGAIPILKILILVLIFSFPFTLLVNAIFVYNKQKKLIISYSLGLFTNIIFNIILIPKLGAVGASFSSLISTIIMTIISWYQMKKINNFKIKSKLKKIIFSTILMTILIIILKKIGVNVIINIIISSIFYFYMLFIFKEQLLKESKIILKNENN